MSAQTVRAWTDYHHQVAAEVCTEVHHERQNQHAKWGEQNHPDGTGAPADVAQAQAMRDRCDQSHANGTGTWADILVEEVAEALAESDPAALRTELVQVAAVAVAWVEAIDRREAGA